VGELANLAYSSTKLSSSTNPPLATAPRKRGQSTFIEQNSTKEKHNISYWDSLVVASALESGCIKLYSEDMQDGLVIDGVLNIINPL